MYFPINSARKLASDPGIPVHGSNAIIALSPSPGGYLFATLTAGGLCIWRLRPSVVLAQMNRSPISTQDHGENVGLEWAPDGSVIVIRTCSHLLLVDVKHSRDSIPYQDHTLAPSLRAKFLSGPGEGMPLERIHLSFQGVIPIDGTISSISARDDFLLYTTKIPNTVQRLSWPTGLAERAAKEEGKTPFVGHDTWEINVEEFPWLVDHDVYVQHVSFDPIDYAEVWTLSDGSIFFVRLEESPQGEVQGQSLGKARWKGLPLGNHCLQDAQDMPLLSTSNSMFSLVAVGTKCGAIHIFDYPSSIGGKKVTNILQPPSASTYGKRGRVSAMQWSPDGYVLAVGFENGWGIWSIGGRCLVWGFPDDPRGFDSKLSDAYMQGIQDLFWALEGVELVVVPFLQATPERPEEVLEGEFYCIPFAKNALATQPAADNTTYALLQLEERIMIYRGADQPDMSIINPESDVWQHIKVPPSYIAKNWPIKYTSVSNDGRLLAIAGRRGLAHYSSTSGKWKCFDDQMQEQAFTVRGGMVWFNHILVVATELRGSYQIRSYSRDLELSTQNMLFREVLTAEVIAMTLMENSLLVYTADNVLSHFIIMPTAKTIQLHLCGSIGFEGVIAFPRTVRSLSWMIPENQKKFGDPTDDLSVARILMTIGGRLVYLKPRKSIAPAGEPEVSYDMQILANLIEFYWINSSGIGALENSLWGYDGQSICVWLDALTIENSPPGPPKEPTKATLAQRNFSFSLDFYPLSALMHKGVILGVDSEHVLKSPAGYVHFRFVTTTHLFLQHVLRHQLQQQDIQAAVRFACHYEQLVFFAHALEVLLHSIIEADEGGATADEKENDATLRAAVDFLDHFDESLEVVVGCARKTEMARWNRLFAVVGKPKALFQACLSNGRLKTAASYLLVLHNLEQLPEDNSEATALLREAMEVEDWQLCRELLRFLRSIDATGDILRQVSVASGLGELPLETTTEEPLETPAASTSRT